MEPTENLFVESEENLSESDITTTFYRTDNDSQADNSSEYSIKEAQDSDIENCDESVLCFETDHAALKGNSDYHSLIKALAVLQAQRIKTIEDIESLEELRIKVRKNPREYLNKLLIGDTSDIPSRIVIQQVPTINWSKYSTKSNEVDSSSQASNSSSNNKDNNEAAASDGLIVRGRMFDQSKPQTFNQLWTAEEQLRLEELLLEYPPGRNENSRWRKIAQALGNRTTKQVCSRVQKYFKKLTKAGLPIPGHQLKTSTMLSLKKNPRKSKKSTARDSTFFPTQHLGAPQNLDDCEDDEIKSRTPALTTELKKDIINKVTEFKRKDSQVSPFSHLGMECSVCGESPLCGTRWKCLVCNNVNLCSDCVIDQLSANLVLHPPSHPLEPVGNPAVAFWDPDYTPHSFQSTNYLDPNFVSFNVL